MTPNLNDPETLQAIVAEGRRLGYTDEAIAERLGIDLAAIRGEQAEPLPEMEAVTGMYGIKFIHQPELTEAVERAIERGRESLLTDTSAGKVALLRKLKREESLYMLADTLGMGGAHHLIARVYHRIGSMDDAANSLNIPKSAVQAVNSGAWPATPEDEKAFSGIAEGLHQWMFDILPDRLRKVILTLLARVSEASYRRGFFQGHQFCSKGMRLAINPDKLRYGGFSLDRSPMPHSGQRRMTSLERLECEHWGALAHVGLILKEDEKVH
jgi:hypothetical protein